MTKRIISILMAAVMMMVFTACAGSNENHSDSKHDTVKVAVSREPTTLVPYDSVDVGTIYVCSQIYDSLLDIDADLELQPSLAESWEVIDDTHYRFKLRDDVYFHNGEKLTAEDVLYSFEKSSTSASVGPQVGPVDNENSYAEDDSTVVIVLSKPYPAFLKLCAMSFTSIVCKTAMEEDPDGFESNPIGTGPFKFNEWASGDYIMLETFEDWWGGDINFKFLQLRCIPEATTRAVEAQSGGVDIAQVTVSDIESLEKDDKVEVITTPILNTSYLSFNCSAEPFNNPKVRQAISLAIDCDAIVKAANYGQAATAKSFLPPMCEGYYEADSEYVGYDVEKAKKLLAEAGYPDGFSCTLISNARQAEAEMIQTYLSEIGIDVELNITDFSNWLDAIVNGRQELYIGGWTLATSDMSECFAALSSANFGEAGNRSFYKNDRVDELIKVIDTEADAEVRNDACKEIQTILADDCVAIGLNVGVTYYAQGKHIKNFESLPIQVADFTKIEFTE